MTNETAQTQTAKPVSQIGQLVVQRKNDIQQIAADLQKMLPPAIPSDKFIRTVQTAITMNPDIAKCDKTSVLSACMKAASDGLILDGREAALVVYNAKQKDGGYKQMAQYMPMVTGIIKRVRNSGEITKINAYVVYKNDSFKVRYGLDPDIKHEPNFEEPGKPIGAYAIARFKDGLDDFEFMPVADIEGIRKRSRSPDKGPWSTDWSEMARKTVIRRLAKRLPMSSDLASVIRRVDEMYDLDAPESNAGSVVENDEAQSADKATPAKKRGAAASKLRAEPASQQTTPETPHDADTGEILDAEYETADESLTVSPREDGAEDLI
jgi:recombination protein RecT